MEDHIGMECRCFGLGLHGQHCAISTVTRSGSAFRMSEKSVLARNAGDGWRIARKEVNLARQAVHAKAKYCFAPIQWCMLHRNSSLLHSVWFEVCL